ncbi:MAG: 30S ribosomal protein S16 [bacterium]|nr:30S ribosomal protein S16 [bacterium]
MVKIKLSPVGTKHAIKFRLVIMEENSKITGREIDQIGFYVPQGKQLEVDQAKLKSWLAKGATPTDSVRKLLDL